MDVLYSARMMPFSLYLHIPFCRHRCNYCDFNTYASLGHLMADYVRALCREMELAARAAGERLRVQTVYFGGGTPSLLSPQQLECILSTVADCFDLTPPLEITLEANPGTLTLPHLCQMRSLGVNRLSLGMQSALPDELRLLERQHSYLEVIEAVRWARRAGFERINLDLIYGLPHQTLDDWCHDLEWALRLHPEHLSLYALTLEHGTPLSKWVERGLVAAPEADLAADMYEWAEERLAQAGFESYEISNWARRDANGTLLACHHNLQYWRNLPYLGFGAGAHGYACNIRTANVRSPRAYIRRCLTGEAQAFPLTPATVQSRRIRRQEEMAETMMMGLRLTQEGIPATLFEMRFGSTLEQVYGETIDELVRLGLLEWAEVAPLSHPYLSLGQETPYPSGTTQGSQVIAQPFAPVRCLRLTRRGRLLGNQVFMRFV
jgi:oxygen-independent coproporphyrinogen-3 oxidase